MPDGRRSDAPGPFQSFAMKAAIPLARLPLRTAPRAGGHDWQARRNAAGGVVIAVKQARDGGGESKPPASSSSM